MTIAERREREAYDRAHPWRPMSEAIVNDGVLCEILFSDLETSRTRLYFLGEDDEWYRVDPPEQIRLGFGWYSGRNPMNWRPTNRKLTPAKRAEIIRAANSRRW